MIPTNRELMSRFIDIRNENFVDMVNGGSFIDPMVLCIRNVPAAQIGNRW